MSQRVNELNQGLWEPVTIDGRFLTCAGKTAKTTIFRPACEEHVEALANVAVGFGSSLA